ncbi:hypothetical protein, partial [Dysgonomonas sp.]
KLSTRHVFHFALMQNETKNQGCIPRRPKTVASVEQNNTESFFVCLLTEYSSHRILLYRSYGFGSPGDAALIFCFVLHQGKMKNMLVGALEKTNVKMFQ